MRDSMSIAYDAKSALAGLDSIALGAQKQVRPAAQAGAQVFYDEVKQNVGRLGRKTGNLDSSIYQVFSKSNSSDKRATYHISWNHIKAPHGHLVEYGTSRAPAYPFVRPAFDTASRNALAAANGRYLDGMQEVLNRLQK